jgi:N-acetylmuramoyl-L-alanine amidase
MALLKHKYARILATFAICVLLIAYCLLLIASSEPELLSIYAPQARYNLPVATIEGRKYVGLLELVTPLAAPEMRIEGKTWKLRIPDPKTSGKTNVEAAFEEGSSIARIRGGRILLSGPALSENHRLLIPLHGIGAALIPLLATDLIFHENSRRLFLAGTAELISTDLRKGDPSTLQLHFPDAVSPNINSDGNAIKFSFTRDPVVSFTENEVLNDRLFSSSSFAENNGAATLTVIGTAPLLARFADNGKTIVISAAPAPPDATATAAPPPPTPEQPSVPEAIPANPVPDTSVNAIQPAEGLPEHVSKATVPTFLVVIDAGHGGSDPGVRITPNLPEKDITLSLARKLRQELVSRHISVTMLRDGDFYLSLEQRAVRTNLVRPAVFVSLHAEPGSALRIYVPAISVASSDIADRNSFLPWQTAQGAFLNESSSFASLTAESFAKRNINAQVRPAFLEPLHSIAAPAIAIEAPADRKGAKIPEDQIANILADAIGLRRTSTGAAQ